MVLVPCPALVGRDDELASLRQALLAASGGRGGVIVLTGEAGVGKSRLLRELCDDARRQGVAVLSGRAVEAASPIPFRPCAEALFGYWRQTGSQQASLLEPLRWVLDRLLSEGPSPTPDAADASTLVVAEAMLQVLRVAGEPSGCLLALEDVQWADAETWEVVEYLADQSREEPVLCVATMRDDEPTDASRKLTALAARRTVTAVEVRRLDDAAAEAMARACLAGEPVTASLRAQIAANAEGLPFLVEELLVAAVSAHAEHGAVLDPPHVPESFAETVRRRLRDDPGVAEVLRAAALFGRSFDWSLLPAATGVAEAEVIARLRRAGGARLIEVETTHEGERFRFRHALTRAAILADLIPPERSALAGRVLTALEAAHPDLPGERCEVAAQLAVESGNAIRAAGLFLEAGQRAVRRGALATAEACLERAQTLPTDDRHLEIELDDTWCSLLALQGDHARLGDVGNRLLASLAASAASPARVATVHLRLARAAVAAADWTTAEWHLQHAGDLALDVVRAEADVLAAEVALGRDEPDRAVESASRALTVARAGGRPDLACEALEVLGRCERQRDLAAAEHAFLAALELAQAHGLTMWRTRALHELGTIDLLAGGPIERLAEARRAALGAGALSTATTVNLQIAAWHLNHVELDAVIDTTRACADEARRLRMTVVEALASVIEASAHGMRGRRAEMERASATALSLAGDVPEVVGAVLLQARASYWLVREHRARTLAALDEGMAVLRPTLATTPFRGMWALVHALEDREGAAAVAEVEASGLTVYWLIRGWVGHARAVILGRAGRHREALDAFATADSTLAPCPWYRQHARRMVAEAAIADGWGDPVAWLTDALAFFDLEGSDRIASACRALLRGAGATVPRRRTRPPVPAALADKGLTARELEVLTLLGDARPTREIAAELFVSPKTVERHIANLAAKVGVQGRAELIAFAARQAIGRVDGS